MAKKRPPQGYKLKPQEQQTGVRQESQLQDKTESSENQFPVAQQQQPDGQGIVDASASTEGADTTADLPTWEHSLIDVEPEHVDERELKGLIRDWRRGRATTSIGQVLSDGYVAVFAAVMIIAMLGGAVWSAQAAAAQCTTDACTVGRTLLPWVALGAVLCLTIMVSKIFGPIVASAAEGFWLMDAPIRRGRLLAARFIGVVLAVGGIAAVLGALLAALTGYDWSAIWQWMAAMGTGAAGLTAFAASEQTWGRTWVSTLVQWLLGLFAVGALSVIVSVAAGWTGLIFPTVPQAGSVVWVSIGGGVLLLVGGGVALARLGMIHRARLVSGGSLVTGMQGAAFAMDFGLMRDILVERASTVLGHVRPMRGRGVGGGALVWREFQRLWRYPKRVLLVLVSIVVPYAVAALGFHTFSPFISSLILLIGFVPMLGSMRIMTRTKGLARTLPLSNPQIRRAMAVVPAVFAIVWAVAATPAFWGMGEVHYATLPQAFTTSALTAVAGLLAAIRWVSAKSANYAAPMMQTGFGAMPPSLMFNLVRGIDVVVLITGPMLLGWAWYISAVIAVIVAIVLSGFYSQEEMQSMQEEYQKEKARGGGGGGGFGAPKTPVAKQKIAPPRGYSGPRAV